jgi:hypothetical protein
MGRGSAQVPDLRLFLRSLQGLRSGLVRCKARFRRAPIPLLCYTHRGFSVFLIQGCACGGWYAFVDVRV